MWNVFHPRRESPSRKYLLKFSLTSVVLYVVRPWCTDCQPGYSSKKEHRQSSKRRESHLQTSKAAAALEEAGHTLSTLPPHASGVGIAHVYIPMATSSESESFISSTLSPPDAVCEPLLALSMLHRIPYPTPTYLLQYDFQSKLVPLWYYKCLQAAINPGRLIPSMQVTSFRNNSFLWEW